MLIRIGTLVLAAFPLAVAVSQPQPATSPAPAIGASAVEGKVVTGSFDHPAGARAYRLFLPNLPSSPRALIVAFHGCAQSAVELARLSRLDEAASVRGFAVLYPEQPATANPLRCWNWFEPSNQHRGAGEPAVVAAMVRRVVSEHAIDSTSIDVIGISAGAAMASVFAVTYPELTRALGLHSAVPYRAAGTVPRAMAVMAGESIDVQPLAAFAIEEMGTRRRAIPVIVIHGSADPVVRESTGRATAELWARINERPAPVGGGLAPEVAADASAERHATVTRYRGQSDVEFWSIEGMGHAWSGGPAGERFADPRGPDATSIMLKFFERTSVRAIRKER